MIQDYEEDALFLYVEMDWRRKRAKNIDTTAAGLARACGVKPSTVRTSISRYERGLVQNSRYMRIGIDKEQLLDSYNTNLTQSANIDKLLGLF